MSQAARPPEAGEFGLAWPGEPTGLAGLAFWLQAGPGTTLETSKRHRVQSADRAAMDKSGLPERMQEVAGRQSYQHDGQWPLVRVRNRLVTGPELVSWFRSWLQACLGPESLVSSVSTTCLL